MRNLKTVDLFVVEDNQLVRLAVTKVISKVSDFRVVGSAEDGKKAVKEIVASKPEIALVDIGLPSLDGIEVTRQIKATLPKLKVLMLTASDKDEHVIEALDAGADGYLLKEAFGERLEMAIRSVKLGAVWLDPAIAKRLLVLASSVQRGARKQAAVPVLSAEDVDLLEEVADSQCSNDICLVEPEFLKKLHKSFSQDQP
jgi:DNA-binding NarL/FixJ family response regulator